MRKCCVFLTLAALLSVLFAAGAAAQVNPEIPWMDEAETIALYEAYYGPYTNWPNGSKDMTQYYLVGAGALEETDDVRKLASEEYINLLSDEEHGALIDKVICDGLGLTPEEIDTLALVERVWGPQESWSGERTAFWAELQEKLARIDGYDSETRETRLRLMLGLEQPDTQLTRDVSAFWSALEKQGYHNFKSWPLEEKARFSRELAPRIRQAVDEDTEYIYKGIVVYTVYDYGLPGEGDMTEEAAREAALDAAAQAFGKERDAFEIHCDYFDVTDAQKPIWRVILHSEDEVNGAYDQWRVQLDARTGEVVEAVKLTLAHWKTQWDRWLSTL